jgi:hypothetical protein
MTALPPPLKSRSQRGRAAGIGATALGALVAVGVATLFLVLIGADRTDPLVSPSGDTAHAERAKPQSTAAAPCSSLAGVLPGRPDRRGASTAVASRRDAPRGDNYNTAEAEQTKWKCVWARLGSAAYTVDVLATTPTTPPALTTTILGQSRFDPIRIDARQFLPDWRAGTRRVGSPTSTSSIRP